MVEHLIFVFFFRKGVYRDEISKSLWGQSLLIVTCLRERKYADIGMASKS
jgi:hypothetical protein